LDAARERRGIQGGEREGRRIVEAYTIAKLSRARRRRWTASIGTLAAAAGIAFAMYALRPQRISFVVGAAHENGVENHWFRTRSEDVKLDFSDGTHVDLLPNTRARVADLTAEGANLTLETGRVSAQVVPRRNANWAIVAGPYTVHVIGTAFQVHWEPEAELLEVTVEHGIVGVTGPVLEGSQRVKGSQRLTVSLPERRATITEDTAPPPPPPSAPEEQKPTSDVDAAASATSAANVEANPAPFPSWKSLAKQGRYRTALDAVNQSGFDQTSRSLGAEDLLLLADVARMGGQPERAQPLLHTLRTRFPKSRAASMAAYTLGASAFDQRQAFADAANWFETYLREQPRGALAREALGRLMEARERAGQIEAARSAAQRYLDAYPTGPHEQLARRLLAH